MFSSKSLAFPVALAAAALIAPLVSAARSAPPSGACAGCRSGVANWNQSFTVQTLAGQCHVSHVIWRADGQCRDVYGPDGRVIGCETGQACGFILDASCAGQCAGVISGMLDATGNFFSIGGCGIQLLTAPFCGWVMPVTQFVWASDTNDLAWATNWLACEGCALTQPPVEPDE